MRCPYCNASQTAVLESRVCGDGESIRRRRDCEQCARRFTTYERIEGPTVMVVKHDGRREPYEPSKLRTGIQVAFHKRPVATDLLEQTIADIEREVLASSVQEVASAEIGKIVLRKIKDIDKVAWLRFASVFLAFENLKDVESVLEGELARR